MAAGEKGGEMQLSSLLKFTASRSETKGEEELSSLHFADAHISLLVFQSGSCKTASVSTSLKSETPLHSENYVQL